MALTPRGWSAQTRSDWPTRSTISTFFTADSLRVMLGIGPTSPFRLHAALKSVGRTHKVQALPLLLKHLCQTSLCVRFGRTRPVLLLGHIREGHLNGVPSARWNGRLATFPVAALVVARPPTAVNGNWVGSILP